MWLRFKVGDDRLVVGRGYVNYYMEKNHNIPILVLKCEYCLQINDTLILEIIFYKFNIRKASSVNESIPSTQIFILYIFRRL